MRIIDIHAHLSPQSFWHAADAGKEWHVGGPIARG